MISSLPQNFKELNLIWLYFDLIGFLTATKFGRHVSNIYESKYSWLPWYHLIWRDILPLYLNPDLNGNLDFEHSLFYWIGSEIIGLYQILIASTDISVSICLVRLTMIDLPFFHISTFTFYFLLYCLSFGLATFFSLRYGESIVQFFLDKLIQRQPRGNRWFNTPGIIGLNSQIKNWEF